MRVTLHRNGHFASASASGAALARSESVTEHAPADLDEVLALCQRAKEDGARAIVDLAVGAACEPRTEMNHVLDVACRVAEEYGAEPRVDFQLPPDGSMTERELHLMQQAFLRRLNASAQPEKIIINVTYRCNNKCSFCAVGTRDQYDGDLGRQREQLLLWRKRGVRYVDFDGGEPTLYEGLLALTAYARAVGYVRVNVTTNGRRLIYEDYAQKLVHSGLTSLLFSIHGPDRATHAREVMVLEAFEQTVTGLRNATRIRDAGRLPVEIGVNITLTKGNYKRLGEVAELALDAGAPWLNVQFLTPFGRATDRVAPDTADAARVTMEVIDQFKDRMRFQVINLPLCFMPGYETWNVGDVGKLDRRMVFVNNEDVNLALYLSERRTKKPVCDDCVHSVACGGFYELDDVPEPRWEVNPADIVKPVSLPLLRER